ncbi:adenosylcobalamin-dependent ribonucleoside-diphosphate reductase [Patescibacteria group bacterium]|nr:adenosylcobalamin-dependent ribonucleoside-diphosphate reductase [Patescibacteria group bacterium]
MQGILALGKKQIEDIREQLTRRSLGVKKRDGREEPFDLAKIERSVIAAGADTGEFGKREAAKVIKGLMAKLQNGFSRRRMVTVDEVRNIVEPAIAQAGYFATAKYYILYSTRKAADEAEWKIREPEMAGHSLEVAKKRYLRTDMQGRVIETPGALLWRVARHMAKSEIGWESEGEVERMAREFFERMVKLKFVCSGKAMFEAGNDGGTGQLSACFVLGIEDSIASIFKTLGEAALIHKNNGGTGFNFSKIRPCRDKVKNVPGAASGPVDFLQAYSAALSKILQGAKRRGGNMAILNADHPDVYDFIRVKEEDGNIKNFNISVGAVDAFMEAVEKGKDWRLVNPRTGETTVTVKARRLFDEIVSAAHKTGDPGMIFLDRVEQDNPTPTLGKLDATNPCGEQPLLPYESCNLSSIVLSRHVKRKNGKRGRDAHGLFGWEVDWDDLGETVRTAIRFLDNMIEVNTYILPEIERVVRHGNRKIGLGVMGFAHLLFKLGIPYGSREAVAMADHLGKFIKREAEAASMELAKARGVFPNFDISYWAGTAERYRNATMLTIAPTGTISLFANCSAGIEPVFSLVTARRTFFEDDRRNRATKTMTIVDPVFEEVLDVKLKNGEIQGLTKRGILSHLKKQGSLSGLKGVPKKMAEVFVTTHEVDWPWHVKIQAAWQKYCDNSVSKTINFKHSAKRKDVKDAYLLAWRLGCKGITIYRDGSKVDQVLSTVAEKHPASKRMETKKIAALEGVCPECGSAMTFAEGCATCPQCAYSYCAV